MVGWSFRHWTKQIRKVNYIFWVDEVRNSRFIWKQNSIGTSHTKVIEVSGLRSFCLVYDHLQVAHQRARNGTAEINLDGTKDEERRVLYIKNMFGLYSHKFSYRFSFC